jgi:hypothetical protein
MRMYASKVGTSKNSPKAISSGDPTLELGGDAKPIPAILLERILSPMGAGRVFLSGTVVLEVVVNAVREDCLDTLDCTDELEDMFNCCSLLVFVVSKLEKLASFR